MEQASELQDVVGGPELTELGKRIEVLRIERGLSKQHLARFAGTSRQQLWRVMTGKSELTTTLRARLIDVLQSPSLDPKASRAMPTASHEFADYVANAGALRRTLATMPVGDAGRALKRRFLDAIEDRAMESRTPLGRDFFEVRRRVLAGEL